MLLSMRTAYGYRLSVLSALIACASIATGCSGNPGIASATLPPVATPATQSRHADALGSSLGVTLGDVMPATMTEVPLAADALANSIGVNSDLGTLYDQPDFSTDVALMQKLGVRHLRDGIIQYADYAGAMSGVLGATGATIDLLTNCTGVASNPATITTPVQIAAFAAAIGNRVEGIEAPNEPDQQGDANWASDITTCLPGLRTALPGVPLVGPGLAAPLSNAQSLGNISGSVDFGNIHRYFSGNNPGSAGWGGQFACGTYGALSWAICEAQINSGSKPIAITETGYSTTQEVDELTQAKYLSRLFLVNLKAGIVRSFIYDFKDNPSDSSPFGTDGLVRADDTPKPSYAAIQSEIALFSDKGAAPSPASFTYALSNQNIDHLLFRKRDGSYLLALWNETSSWNTSTNTEVVVKPQLETITLPQLPSAVSAQALGDTGTFTTSPVTTVGMMASVWVDDHVTVVSFKL